MFYPSTIHTLAVLQILLIVYIILPQYHYPHLYMPWRNLRVLNAHTFDDPLPTLICSICDRHFSSRGGWTRHIVAHHPGLTKELNLQDPIKPQPPPIPSSPQHISGTPLSSPTNHSSNLDNLDNNLWDHDGPNIYHPEDEHDPFEDFPDQPSDRLQHDPQTPSPIPVSSSPDPSPPRRPDPRDRDHFQAPHPATPPDPPITRVYHHYMNSTLSLLTVNIKSNQHFFRGYMWRKRPQYPSR